MRTYLDINEKIHDIYQDAANDCMKAAANDVRLDIRFYRQKETN